MTEVETVVGAEDQATETLRDSESRSTATTSPHSPEEEAWAPWQRLLFRFFFIYLLLQIAPWTWVARVPGMRWVARLHNRIDGWAVEASNARFFHVRETLIPTNGSGDTSYAWAQLWLYLSLALLGCLIWTALDRRRSRYPHLAYWLRTVVRYYIATFCLTYGIIKLFRLQMPFPALSQLATPLGDLLPMRLSWMFLGYSAPYQIFSGVMETVAGLLLLYRKTVTLGLFVATGAFINVVMINLGYDVPVKLFSSHLLLACVFLLVLDARRLLALFVLNRPVSGTSAYEPPYQKPWQRRSMLAVKAVLIWFILVVPMRSSWARYQVLRAGPSPGPFELGVYEVTRFQRGGLSAVAADPDPQAWKDVIFDSGGSGSVGTADTLFWQRYGRGYFRYKDDPERHSISVWRTSFALDSIHLFDMRYQVPDTRTVRLWTTLRGDSLYLELRRTDRHFQLAERQFHWLSEYNR